MVRDVLLGRSTTELEDWAIAQGQNAFRGRQIYDWIYNKGVKSLTDITVLPKQWRVELDAQNFRVGRLRCIRRFVASDATTKLLLATDDGEIIETVGIPTNQRLTVCVSSQVGCPMACRFCATGKGGLQRSLATHEIVDQVLSVREAMDRRPSHIVFMGMGEPLLNSEMVLESIRCFNIDLGISQRRITVSTIGVPKTLPQLAELAIKKLGRAQFTLAVSLHAPNQRLREELIPTAHSYPYDALLSDCHHYLSMTGRRVSFEYILLKELNDRPEHAAELADRLGGFQSHINLIAYNPIEEQEFKRPALRRIEAFRRVLERRGVAVSLRVSRGLDQNAACGQLRRQHVAEVS
ncbi:23S rRNA (adenine(2503)-C(2))-methyltransferase RlmN [Synechococcus sp. M16CYN]|uniref:23S rRNA (adenine(2503)-C(2))-methyltransferase RlmN n=1 Tax=Synechococcus sp. M16CYN TaxID=3103139 RepID=UPI003250E9AE